MTAHEPDSKRHLAVLIFGCALLSLMAHATGNRVASSPRAVRDVVLSGVVLGAHAGTPEPVRARVFAVPRTGRCEWSDFTDADGRFTRSCFGVEAGEHIVLGAIWSPFRPWTGGVVVPGEGTAMPTLVIELPTPSDPSPTPTITDHLGWHWLEGSVRDSHGPIEGAIVSVTPCGSIGLARGMHCLSPVSTDPEGAFEVWCDGGHQLYSEYCVEINHADHEPFATTVPVASGVYLEVELKMSPRPEIDVAAEGGLWLAMYTDFFSGGARLLNTDLEAVGGFATRTLSQGIAVDAAGDVLLLQAGGAAPGLEGPETIERHRPDGSHQGRIGSSDDFVDFDGAGAARAAWALVPPDPPGDPSEGPVAVRFDDGVAALPGFTTFAAARLIAGAPDGTYYVSTDRDTSVASAPLVMHFGADGSPIGSWSIDHPIAAIDVNRADGTVWVASSPPSMPDLSKTRIQGFRAGGGSPTGTAFADFEMDIEAIDIAAGSVSFGDIIQCSVYGVGTFGIGSLRTIVRHDCSGALLATTRDIPSVGIWTPMPTATPASAETSEPSATPTATQTATATTTTDPDATATATDTPPPITSETPPTPTDVPDPDPTTLRIHLPIVVDFALRADFSVATAEPSDPETRVQMSAGQQASAAAYYDECEHRFRAIRARA